MKKERFFELLSDIDEGSVNAAGESFRGRRHRRSLVMIAAAVMACAAVICAGVYRALRPGGGVEKDSTPESTQSKTETDPPDDSEDAMALEQGDVDIYYVRDGELHTAAEFMEMTPQNVFAAWKEYNSIGDDVQLIGVRIDNGGTETIDSNTAQYTAGDEFTMTVTVSAGLESVLKNDPMLEQSLEKTMTSYGDPDIKYDGFTLVFD